MGFLHSRKPILGKNPGDRVSKVRHTAHVAASVSSGMTLAAMGRGGHEGDLDFSYI